MLAEHADAERRCEHCEDNLGTGVVDIRKTDIKKAFGAEADMCKRDMRISMES
jgi:hypothetical protein